MNNRALKFALVGGIGTVLNLALMAGLIASGAQYVLASIAATETTIVTNFLLQERWVFRDLVGGSRYHRRAVKAALFNNAEYLLRAPFLLLLVEAWQVNSVVAQGITLAVAFVARFVFSVRFVYRPLRYAVAAETRLVPDGGL